jgi:hypothetical protein
VSDRRVIKSLGFPLCSLQEFFLTVKDMARCTSSRAQVSSYQKWEEDELKVHERFIATKDSVHAALCGKDSLFCHPT